MSEFSVSFFVQYASHGEDLKVLLSGLCKGELGAYIEERVEPFGAKAEAAAERMLDDWGSRNNTPSFDGFTLTETGIELSMISGYSIEEDIAMLTDLLTLCGATVTHTPNYLVDIGQEPDRKI